MKRLTASCLTAAWVFLLLSLPQVLADFVRVITPSAAPEGDNTLGWVRQLPAGVTASNGLSFSTAAACSSISTAANAAGRCGRAEPARICPNAYRCGWILPVVACSAAVPRLRVFLRLQHAHTQRLRAADVDPHLLSISRDLSRLARACVQGLRHW